jgi:hypothetical protein
MAVFILKKEDSAMGNFKLANGMKVSNMNGIHECYELEYRNSRFVFTANISATHIEKFVRLFCEGLVEPCFLILETPTNGNVENILRETEPNTTHCDVFYLDGLSRERLLALIDKYGALLINDGMVHFGFASHKSHDELYFADYNIATLFTPEKKEGYKQVFADFDIPEEDEIKTVWQNFSYNTPGDLFSIEVDGKDIYDIIEELKEEGLYFAERREQQ